MSRFAERCFMIACMSGSALGLAGPVASVPGPGFELLFEDQFDGAGPDTSRWDYRVGERTGLYIDSFNTKESVRLRDGNLVIRNNIELIEGKERNTGGGLITKQRFGFGYYEVRARPFLGGHGLHSAFWQLGTSTARYQNGIFEIDSFEIDAPRLLTTHNLYVRPNSLGREQAPWPYRANMPIHVDSDGWLVSAYDYAPDGITFYDGGKVVAHATFPLDFPDLVAQQNVWLSALNGVGKVERDKQPGETWFDYFKFYARDYPGQNLLANGTFEYNRTQIALQTPIAWEEEGDVDASAAQRSNTAHGGRHVLHLGADRAYSVSTHQTLQNIRDGEYALAAWMRSSAKLGKAAVVVESGGQRQHVLLSPNAAWTRIELPTVQVRGHTVRIAIESAGGPSEWVEVDDVTFMKPGPAPAKIAAMPYDPARGPVWRIFERTPMAFGSDKTFFFFDRNVGIGPGVTVAATLTPARLQNAMPVVRSPATGKDGWAMGIDDAGGAWCAIGSAADKVRASVAKVYRKGVDVALACSYQGGQVRLYVDGVERAARQAPGFGTNDASAAGRLGATVNLYDAVGDVTGDAATRVRPVDEVVNFTGAISKVAIFNRALDAAEIAALVIN